MEKKADLRVDFALPRHNLMREDVYIFLRDDILSGKYLPGTRIVETHFAKQINTSRTPVREALHMLEREGLLQTIPRVGYIVSEIDARELDEICEIRAINEALAARWAMRNITLKEIQALKKNIKASMAKITEDRNAELPSLNAEFHNIIYHASGSKRLAEHCELLRRQMVRGQFHRITNLQKVVVKAIQDHNEILKCIIDKDEEKIEQVIRKHMEHYRDDVKKHYFAKEEKNSLSP